MDGGGVWAGGCECGADFGGIGHLWRTTGADDSGFGAGADCVERALSLDERDDGARHAAGGVQSPAGECADGDRARSDDDSIADRCGGGAGGFGDLRWRGVEPPFHECGELRVSILECRRGDGGCRRAREAARAWDGDDHGDLQRDADGDDGGDGAGCRAGRDGRGEFGGDGGAGVYSSTHDFADGADFCRRAAAAGADAECADGADRGDADGAGGDFGAGVGDECEWDGEPAGGFHDRGAGGCADGCGAGCGRGERAEASGHAGRTAGDDRSEPAGYFHVSTGGGNRGDGQREFHDRGRSGLDGGGAESRGDADGFPARADDGFVGGDFREGDRAAGDGAAGDHAAARSAARFCGRSGGVRGGGDGIGAARFPMEKERGESGRGEQPNPRSRRCGPVAGGELQRDGVERRRDGGECGGGVDRGCGVVWKMGVAVSEHGGRCGGV